MSGAAAPWCYAGSGALTCDLPPGHPGEHVAHDADGQVCGTWTTADGTDGPGGTLLDAATFRPGDRVRTTYSSSPRDERLVVTGYIEMIDTGEELVDVYPEGGEPVGQSLLFPVDVLQLLLPPELDFRTGDRVKIREGRGRHAGRLGVVEVDPDDPTSDGSVWVRVYGAATRAPYGPAELEHVDDGDGEAAAPAPEPAPVRAAGAAVSHREAGDDPTPDARHGGEQAGSDR